MKELTKTEEVKMIIDSIGTENELLIVSDVAGWGWYDGGSILGLLKPGKKLRMVREASNTHDKMAVALYFSNTKIGYVPKKDNAKIAELIDNGQGRQLQARILSVDTGRPAQLQVTFYIYQTPEL